MLTQLAMRICAVRALMGATIAQDRVFDSALVGLEHFENDPRPGLLVATEDTKADTEVLAVGAGTRRCELVIDVVVASKVTVTIDGGTQTEVVIPHTDAGLEMSVNILARQVSRTLFADGGGEWGALFREIVQNVDKVNTKRSGGADKGVRYAAVQVSYVIEPLDAPAFGQEPEPDTLWGRFLAQLAADPLLAQHEPLIRSAIVGDPLPQWRVNAAIMGITPEEARAVALVDTMEFDGEEISAVATQMTADFGDGTEIIVDAAAISSGLPPEEVG